MPRGSVWKSSWDKGSLVKPVVYVGLAIMVALAAWIVLQFAYAD